MEQEHKKRMPVLFAGHGSPINAIEDNAFTRTWRQVAASLPRPRAILAVSAHWYVEGTRICEAERPRQIYDFFGFPKELYEVRYDVPGSPDLAAEVMKLLGAPVHPDQSWGIDHGTWSVLRVMVPEADIPVVQLSIDRRAPFARHYEWGRQLKLLRERGVLIFGSGNVVHNLAKLDWDNPAGGFAWADRFDAAIRDSIVSHEFENVIHSGELAGFGLAVPTSDHFLPLLYVLGAADVNDEVTVFNDARAMGSLSMTGYLLG